MVNDYNKHDTSTLPGGDHRNAHICNCMGCCEKCGGCRTDPRHALVCERVAQARADINNAFDEAKIMLDLRYETAKIVTG